MGVKKLFSDFESVSDCFDRGSAEIQRETLKVKRTDGGFHITQIVEVISSANVVLERSQKTYETFLKAVDTKRHIAKVITDSCDVFFIDFDRKKLIVPELAVYDGGFFRVMFWVPEQNCCEKEFLNLMGHLFSRLIDVVSGKAVNFTFEENWQDKNDFQVNESHSDEYRLVAIRRHKRFRLKVFLDCPYAYHFQVSFTDREGDRWLGEFIGTERFGVESQEKALKVKAEVMRFVKMMNYEIYLTDGI